MKPTLDQYKLRCELLGHSADVRAVATSDSRELIVSGSRDKTAKVWKRNEGEENFSETITYQDHQNFVASVYYLESAHWICTGSNDASVCIYQETGYVPILTLKGHEATVCAIAAGVAKQSLITGSWDKTARIWLIDQLGGYTSVTLRGHEAAVWSVAAMPATQQFITGSADKCIFYWNAAGERLRMLKGHTDCVRGLVALANGSLASCANDAIIRFWNEDGECERELTGHTNYIYAIAQNRHIGEEVVVSCGEDSTLRMWNLATGLELGAPIIHPAQSVWSVACLSNGDIVTGSSDGIVRVFTLHAACMADAATLSAFELAVSARRNQMNEDLGGMKKTDLPGPEVLLQNGTAEGQTKMVRHPDGSVKVYNWTAGEWQLIGDVTGASGGSQASSGKTLHEGKEYDFVFSVDISDTQPAIKLPYNHGEDPWKAAQAFIHRHDLPQAYLDQVANFIVKNSQAGQPQLSVAQPGSSGYQDPFTGGSRYVPGSGGDQLQAGGNVDPFTGGSSYSTTTAASAGGAPQKPQIEVNFVKGSERHFPVSKYVTFDHCDAQKVLEKLKEFNTKLSDKSLQVSDTLLEEVMQLAVATPQPDSTALEALRHLLRWPENVLFPVLDVVRLAVRDETIFVMLNSMGFLEGILPRFYSSPPNQLMLMRCLANMMAHAAGREQILTRLAALATRISAIREGSVNLQIAIATFYLNVSIAETLGVAQSGECRCLTAGLVELLKWTVDLETSYRCIQGLGNLTTTPHGKDTIAQVVSVDYVMDRLRQLASTQQSGPFDKVQAAGKALLAAF